MGGEVPDLKPWLNPWGIDLEDWGPVGLGPLGRVPMRVIRTALSGCCA